MTHYTGRDAQAYLALRQATYHAIYNPTCACGNPDNQRLDHSLAVCASKIQEAADDDA